MKSKLLGIAAIAALGTAQASTMSLTATLRDFKIYTDGGHIDFQNECCGDDLGIVTSTLGADGKPVYANNGGYSTHGAAAFNQWYNDVPGVNISKPYNITLDNTANSDVYTYANSDFFPLDGDTFPGESHPLGHNYGFTLELNTNFTYAAGQNFTFTGDDDVFVYINNSLVIDLGGVHGAESKSVDLDLLGLTAGNNYSMNVFFAERHTSASSSFRIDTNIESLVTTDAVPEPGTLAMFGLGAAGLAMALRRRKK